MLCQDSLVQSLTTMRRYLDQLMYEKQTMQARIEAIMKPIQYTNWLIYDALKDMSDDKNLTHSSTTRYNVMLRDITYSRCDVQAKQKDHHANQGNKSLYTCRVGFNREDSDNNNDNIQAAKANHTPSSWNAIKWCSDKVPCSPHWCSYPWKWDIFEEHKQAKECIDQAEDQLLLIVPFRNL